MTEIPASQLTTLPYSAICYITSLWPDGSRTRASGTVVGDNDVLTALHVIYQAPRGGYAVSYTISPGADTAPALVTPLGTWTDVGSVSGRTGNWDTNGDGLLSAAESQYDLAVIGLKSRIADFTGKLAPLSAPFDFYGAADGYPARGTGLMTESVYADASSRYGVYDIASSLGAGASGGPLLLTSGASTWVVGTLSSGDAANTQSTYAGLFGPGNWDWLTSALAANDSLVAGVRKTLVGADGDNVYDFAATDFVSAGLTVTDSGGTDTFSTAGISTSVQISLDPAKDSSIRGYAVGISADTAIENAIAGPGNDVIVGNALANRLSGGAGNDVLVGAGGNDTLDGGAGLDVAVYGGTRAGYAVSATAAGAVVIDRTPGRDGTDTLANVERLRFTDVSVALDLQGNAGVVAKVLGAVFGAAGVANAAYVGIGLQVLDAGGSYNDLMLLALNARLGAGFTPEAEVRVLYQNIFGAAPADAAVAVYVAALQSGQYTQVSLGEAAAETPENAARVNLVGLAATGIDYIAQA